MNKFVTLLFVVLLLASSVLSTYARKNKDRHEPIESHESKLSALSTKNTELLETSSCCRKTGKNRLKCNCH